MNNWALDLSSTQPQWPCFAHFMSGVVKLILYLTYPYLVYVGNILLSMSHHV